MTKFLFKFINESDLHTFYVSCKSIGIQVRVDLKNLLLSAELPDVTINEASKMVNACFPADIKVKCEVIKL